MSKTIMIASGKGGTGKSMISVNLGLALQNSGHSTIVVDMDFCMRTLDLYLGAQNRALFDMGDVINGTCCIDKALIDFPDLSGLRLMPASQAMGDADIVPESVEKVIEELNGSAEYIILDCAPGICRMNALCMDAADYVILVVTPDYASIRDAEAVEDKLLRNGVFGRSYIVNKIMPYLVEKKCEPDYREIDERLKCGMLGMILYDDNIRASTNIGVPIVAKKDTYITQNFERISERLIAKLSVDE